MFYAFLPCKTPSLVSRYSLVTRQPIHFQDALVNVVNSAYFHSRRMLLLSFLIAVQREVSVQLIRSLSSCFHMFYLFFHPLNIRFVPSNSFTRILLPAVTHQVFDGERRNKVYDLHLKKVLSQSFEFVKTDCKKNCHSTTNICRVKSFLTNWLNT